MSFLTPGNCRYISVRVNWTGSGKVDFGKCLWSAALPPGAPSNQAIREVMTKLNRHLEKSKRKYINIDQTLVNTLSKVQIQFQAQGEMGQAVSAVAIIKSNNQPSVRIRTVISKKDKILIIRK